jgi:hypothetical protein
MNHTEGIGSYYLLVRPPPFPFVCVFNYVPVLQRWPGSSVRIATGYGLDGPGIESRWGRVFPHLSRPALGPTQPPVQWVSGLSRGQKMAGRDAVPPPF